MESVFNPSRPQVLVAALLPSHKKKSNFSVLTMAFLSSILIIEIDFTHQK